MMERCSCDGSDIILVMLVSKILAIELTISSRFQFGLASDGMNCVAKGAPARSDFTYQILIAICRIAASSELEASLARGDVKPTPQRGVIV